MRTLRVLPAFCLISLGACTAEPETAPVEAPAQEAAAPVLEERVDVLVDLQVPEDAEEAFLAAMRNNVKNTREEPGNVSFTLYRDDADPLHYMLVERWKSRAVLEQHLETPHLQRVERTNGAHGVKGKGTEMNALSPVTEHPIPAGAASTRNVIVRFHTKAESRKAFLTRAQTLTDAARAAPGNLAFGFYQAEEDPDLFILVERWTDAESHEASRERDYDRAFLEGLSELLTDDPMKSRSVPEDVSLPAS